MLSSSILIILIGFITGALLTFLVIFLGSPSIIMKESRSKYNFETTLEELRKVVEEKGWKLPCEHDLKATMAKFNFQVNDVAVLEICNPSYANNILSQDDERIVSSLMPCRIAVYEKSNGLVYISRMNSGLLSKPMNRIIRRTMTAASKDTEVILNRVIMK